MRHSRSLIAALAAAAITIVPSVAPAARAPRGVARGAGAEMVQRIHLVATVNLSQMARSATRSASVTSVHILRTHVQHWKANSNRQAPQAELGGTHAPNSRVEIGGDNGHFLGINSIDQETGGTGAYANKNPILEPPDQGLCVGNGYVIEAVNDALRVYTSHGRKLTTKSVPLAQFFARAAGGTTGPTDFISDPRCIFDASTNRWFVTTLDIHSVPVYPEFMDDQNFIAVSKSGNPMGSWYIYSFDVTDNGLNGSPVHTGCLPGGVTVWAGCLGDQPTIGSDEHGIYISDNEYAFAEVFPVAPPVIPPLQQIPVLRSGVAQLYALSKEQLIHGTDTTLVRFDSNSIPFPGPAEDGPWQSISPARPVANDGVPEPRGGVEYFLSSIGLPVAHNVGQIVAWAWTNTASLSSGHPNLALQHVIIKTAKASDTFYAPDPSAGTPFPAYQKDGPHPLAAKAGDPEEYLNANDDRMNWVTLSSGALWTGVNTQLPATSPGAAGHAGEKRVGIMYFKVIPSITGGRLSAHVATDGYISVPDNNVLFPSIAPRADGVTIVNFTIAGLNYYPSVGWARLDGLAPGEAPVVHIAMLGNAPEDGFTGLGTLGSQGLGLRDVPPCGPCVARWGDYSESQVDGTGCVWGAGEFIPSEKHDSLGATNWGTGIYRVCPS